MTQTAAYPRVAFVAGTLGRGGAERQLYYTLSVLQKAGAAPRVFSLTRDEHWEKPIRDLGVPMEWFGQSHNQAARVGRLIDLLRHDRPEFVQAAHFHTNLYAVAAARALGTGDIGAIRNDTNWSVASLGRLGHASLHLPRHLAVNSLASIEQTAAAGRSPSRLTFLPNVVDTDRFSPSPERRAGVHLLTVGRLVEQKRHDRFIRLVARVVERMPERAVTATLVGEGPLLHDLKKQVGDLGLTGVVRFVENPDMHAAYTQASLFVLTSDFEGTPNVVLEAMAMALPVVAFSIGGVREVIPSTAVGVTVPPGDEDELCKRVLSIAQSPDTGAALGRGARQFVIERLSLQRLPFVLDLLYRRAMVHVRVNHRRGRHVTAVGVRSARVTAI